MKKGFGPSLILDGKIWHYRFQRAGDRKQRSTHTTIRARAEEIASAAFQGESPKPTVKEHAENWRETHEGIVSAAHLRNMGYFVRRHLYHLGETRIDQVTTEDVERARKLHLVRYSPASTNQWLRNLRLLYGWAIRLGLIEKIPWRVGMIRLQKSPRAILPAAKATSWLAAVDAAAGDRWGVAAVIRLALGLGLREREAIAARWEWVDWERHTFTCGESKGKETVPLPVPEWLLEYLRPRKQPEGLIAPSPRGGQYTAGITWKTIQKANAAAGVVGLSAHRLRGSYATLLSECGMPIQGIQQMLRHKDIKTTAAYLEVNLEQAAGVQEEVARRLGLAWQGWRKNGGPGETDVRP